MKLVLLLTLLWASVLKAEQIGYSHAPRGAEGRFKIDLLNDYVKTMRIGMDFAVIFQNLENENAANNVSNLDAGFQNATGNLNLDTELIDGMTTYVELYLSSEHHTEMFMKEGYLLIEKLPMFDLPWLNSIMKYTTIKAGQMEINYGDYHLRRSDNADVSRNPLIGNAVIDTNITETGVELMFDIADLELMVAASNGAIKEDNNYNHGSAFYSKLAYDKTFGDLRLRLSGSYYQVDHSKNASNDSKSNLYSGNRSGARYQNLLGANSDAGQVKPDITQDVSAYVINLLLQFKGLEIFGNYEVANDKDPDGTDSSSRDEEEWAQYFVDLKYNFTDNFYLAGRYNIAEHKKKAGVSSNEEVNRTQIGLGYSLTQTVLLKGEWVKQEYKNYPTSDTTNNGAKFDGWSIEASVSF